MAIISTGQFTIVDQNDAKPIMAFISANGALQQSYSKENGITKYNPDRTVSNLTLTAKIYVGGVDYTTSTAVTGRIWSTTFDGSNVAGTDSSTYVLSTNISTPETTPSQTYYFRATYTDPTTAIQSRIDAQITLSAVIVGSNATYITIQGKDVIEKSPTVTKDLAVVKAELVRSSGIDIDALQYRWYSVATNGVATQLIGSQTNYGLKSTAPGASPTAVSGDLPGTFPSTAGDWTAAVTATTSLVPTAISGNGSAVTVTFAAQGSQPFATGTYVVLSGVTPSAYNGTWKVTEGSTTTAVLDSTATGTVTVYGTIKSQSVGSNTLVIGENAVTNYQLFKVEIRDSTDTATIYSQHFTVYDVSDNYTVKIQSDGGDRLLNGTGSTNLTPKVYYGNTEVSNYNSWSFNWYLYDKNQVRVGFVKDTSPFSRSITSNTANGLVLGSTVSSTDIPAGTLVKLVSSDGTIIKYCETDAGSGTASLALRSTIQNTTYPNDNNNVAVTSVSAGVFNGGTMYRAVAGKVTTESTTQGQQVTTPQTLTITQYDVDSKNTIFVDANKP